MENNKTLNLWSFLHSNSMRMGKFFMTYKKFLETYELKDGEIDDEMITHILHDNM